MSESDLRSIWGLCWPYWSGSTWSWTASVSPAHLGRVQLPTNKAPLRKAVKKVDAYRFDASDLMPANVGTGTFWQGVVAWVEGAELDTVLRGIDESWPAEE